MEEYPAIKTAIPKRRYQMGRYSASLLGEIESGDARQYRFILAFVPAGKSEPSLYVCSEAAAPAERSQGAYRLRVVGEMMDDVLDVQDRWGDLDAFAEQGLQVGAQMLGLGGQPITRLM